MLKILRFFVFLTSIITILCESTIQYLNLTINTKNPLIEINNMSFSIRMDIPMLIFKKECLESNETKMIELNGVQKNIPLCKENIININNISTNITQKIGANSNLENYFGLGKISNDAELSIIESLNKQNKNFTKKIMFESYLNKFCNSTKETSNFYLGIYQKIEKDDKKLEEREMEISFDNENRTNYSGWATKKFNGYYFGNGSDYDADMMKDNSTFINLSDSDTAIFQEGISYKEPSIFPDTYLEKLLNLTNKYGCKKIIVDNDTLTSQLKCDERNLSLFLVFDKNALKVNSLFVNNGSNFINILFKKNQTDYILNPSILGSLHRFYNYSNNIFGISSSCEEIIDLTEPTVKESIITIIIITILVIIITFIVMKLMKKDTNDNVDYNNMQQI